MMRGLDDTLHRAVDIAGSPITATTMHEWYQQFKTLTASVTDSTERALLGGIASTRVGFAFVAGYQSAIERLFDMQDQRLSSVCVTETAGNHPRHIQARLETRSDGMRLHGDKQFVSGAEHAERIFVACKTGEDKTGRPQLKMVQIDLPAEGVDITPLPELGFVPEVSHGKVHFDTVNITSLQVLPGDGYTDYVKPFRTAEDIHVLCALTAYRLACGLRQQWPQALLEAHMAILSGLHQVAQQNIQAPATHLQLAGLRQQMTQLIECSDPLFEQADAAGYACWVRDRKLLKVAKGAHEKRTENAWQAMGYRSETAG